MRASRTWAAAWGATFVAAAAWAAVDVEVRNGDRVAGTLSPATETETIRFRVPKGALITVKAAAARRPLQLRVLLRDPHGAPVGEAALGRSVVLSRKPAAASGLYSVEVSSKDGVAAGDYRISATWKSPTSFAVRKTVGANVRQNIEFAADAGAVATFVLTRPRTSAAWPYLDWLTLPDAASALLSGAKDARPLASTGDYAVSFGSVVAGDVAAVVKVKPPRARLHRYELTSKTIVGGDAEGGAAFAAVVGPAGGLVTFPTAAVGLPGSLLAGASVRFPAHRIFDTSILVSTAPPIDASAPRTPAGTTVAFGPRDVTFGTNGASPDVTFSIPFDPAFTPVSDQITILARDAKGAATAVPRPYAFNADARTVSFAFGRLATFRAVSDVPAPPPSFFTVATSPLPADICEAHDPDVAAASPIRFYYTDRKTDVVHALRDSLGGGFSDEEWAGIGSVTTTPTDRLQFSFDGALICVSADPSGVLYAASISKVFRIDPALGVVTLLAGGGNHDSGPSTAAQARFFSIQNILADGAGRVFVADVGTTSHRIRVITTTDEPPSVRDWAGIGYAGLGKDGELPSKTSFSDWGPGDLMPAPGGGLYVADDRRIRWIDPDRGINITVAGDLTLPIGAGGDGGPPTAAKFTLIRSIAPYRDPLRPSDDLVLVADRVDHTVRLVDLTKGVVRTIAGEHGVAGIDGDSWFRPGRLDTPTGVVADADGALIADSVNSRIRKVTGF